MLNDFVLIPSNLAGLFSIAGFLLIAHAHNRKHYISNLLKRGTKTEAKVIEMRKNPGSLFSKEEGQGFAPVVEYTTISGNTLKHYSSTFKLQSPYEEGMLVPLWYINYRSTREATLEDDLPGDLPRKLFIAGSVLLTLSLPNILIGLSGLI